MAIHWDIPFKSLRSARTYWVSVYDNSYGSNTPVELKGGVVPFETQEDTDYDWFKPVRTQSGYLRIMDDGNDLSGYPLSSGDKWTDMIPSDDKNRKVILTSGGVTYWRGYLQPQTFSGILYENAQERQFPVACPLSVLEGVDVDTTARGMVTFAYLLDYLLTETGYSWPYIYFQGSDAYEWLKKKVDWENFIETDDEGVRRAKYNCLELLEELCKFWGWSCRTYGESIYFLSPDDHLSPHLTMITQQDLWSINAGYSPQYSTVSWQSVDTDNDIYASTDNNIEYVRGIRKATVTADINRMANILKIDFDKITEILRKLTPPSVVDQGGVRYYTITGLQDGYVSNEYEIKLTWDQSDIRAQFSLTDSCDLDEIAYKHNYDWKCFLSANDGSTASGMYAVRMTLKKSISLAYGMLVIDGNTSSSSNGFIIARLRIGDKYWDGSSWVATESLFSIPFGDERNTGATSNGKIICNRSLDAAYPSYTGHGVPIETAIGGTLVFEIVSVQTTAAAGQRVVRISDFSISFVRKNTAAEESENQINTYIEDSGSVFSDESSVSTIFATDKNNTFGLGIIREDNLTYCQEVGYVYSGGATYEHPEQHLVERMASRGESVKLKETIEVRSNLINITPITDCETYHMSGYPIAISHNWCDDIAKVIILEY